MKCSSYRTTERFSGVSEARVPGARALGDGVEKREPKEVSSATRDLIPHLQTEMLEAR